MNSIEYNKAKAELKDKKWRKDNLHGSAEFTWHMKQHISLLESVLLAYRREHNIFDVGDKVIYDEFKSVGTFERNIGSSNRLASTNYGLGGITVLIKFLRHATDEEIKAGHRL